MPIEELLGSKNPQVIIDALRVKSVDVPRWSDLLKDYEPTKHKICSDLIGRKDRQRSDGTLEKASRIYIGLEKLLTNRFNEYTFSIPVKRVYSNVGDNEVRKQIVRALESIYKHARIDSVNLKRGLAYYASCEIFTIWYTVRRDNTLYGFPSKYKLKCKTYSPMEGVVLYPYIDDRGDMLAMSFEYKKRVGEVDVLFFETYTADRHYIWKQDGNAGWQEVTKNTSEDGEEISGERISILKIPGVYISRPVPVYHGLSYLREEIEYTLSRNSDVIAYNSAPVLKVVGDVKGEEVKGESRRAFRLANGGDVAYVSWNQSIDSLKFNVDMLVRLFFMQSQMPDISFENMKGLGNIGYDARQSLFTDAHLRIGEEAGAWIEFLERECNVIKAFLGQMNVKFQSELDNVEVEHIITPFLQDDEKYQVEKWLEANGGKPLIGHLESIRKAGLSADPAAAYKELTESTGRSFESMVQDIFGGSRQ